MFSDWGTPLPLPTACLILCPPSYSPVLKMKASEVCRQRHTLVPFPGEGLRCSLLFPTKSFSN